MSHFIDLVTNIGGPQMDLKRLVYSDIGWLQLTCPGTENYSQNAVPFAELPFTSVGLCVIR